MADYRRRNGKEKKAELWNGLTAEEKYILSTLLDEIELDRLLTQMMFIENAEERYCRDVIVFCGKPGTGKTTVWQWLRKRYEKNPRIGFAAEWSQKRPLIYETPGLSKCRVIFTTSNWYVEEDNYIGVMTISMSGSVVPLSEYQKFAKKML